MKPVGLKVMSCAMALVVGGILAAGPVMAEKPDWAGKGGKSAAQKGGKKDMVSRSAGERRHFQDQHRVAVHEYYSEQFRGGHCPPGLAKKRNGCMPPGQAKKWQMGRPLPRDVIYYDVPQSLVVQIGVPPAGHRYVRVASDILMIAVGTGMVGDAIQDLGRM